MELKGKIINFLGDSITEGAGVSNPENIYHQRIMRDYGLEAANNYGISGTRIARQLVPSVQPSFDKYFASRVEEMDENADAVVVFGGTNDYGHGDAYIGAFTDREPDTYYGGLHNLFIKLINKYPGKPIIILTPLHRINEERPTGDGNKERVYAPLKTYVEILKEVAQYYSLPVCDLYSISGIQPAIDIIKEKYCPDGLHPNDAGHEIIAERVGNFLKNL